jgi:hypothetical protein
MKRTFKSSLRRSRVENGHLFSTERRNKNEMLSNVETSAVFTQTKGREVAQSINPLMPAGRTARKKILKNPFIALIGLVLLAVTITACKKPNNDPDTAIVITYPVDIPITEYPLGINCIMFPPVLPDTLYLVNSQEEFSSLISCDDLPDINFNKYSLVLGAGASGTVISSITKQLQQLSANEYHLKIDIRISGFTKADLWSISILIPKMPQDAVINLSLTINK